MRDPSSSTSGFRNASSSFSSTASASASEWRRRRGLPAQSGTWVTPGKASASSASFCGVVFVVFGVLSVFSLTPTTHGLQCYVDNMEEGKECKAINRLDPDVKTCDVEECTNNQTNCKRVTEHVYSKATRHFQKYTYLIGCTEEVLGKDQIDCIDDTQMHKIHEGLIGNITCLCAKPDFCNGANRLERIHSLCIPLLPIAVFIFKAYLPQW